MLGRQAMPQTPQLGVGLEPNNCATVNLPVEMSDEWKIFRNTTPDLSRD